MFFMSDIAPDIILSIKIFVECVDTEQIHSFLLQSLKLRTSQRTHNQCGKMKLLKEDPYLGTSFAN